MRHLKGHKSHTKVTTCSSLSQKETFLVGMAAFRMLLPFYLLFFYVTPAAMQVHRVRNKGPRRSNGNKPSAGLAAGAA